MAAPASSLDGDNGSVNAIALAFSVNTVESRSACVCNPDLSPRTQSYFSSCLEGQLIKFGFAGRGISRCEKLFSGFIVHCWITEGWG